jgi:5-methyltetrahydrofolate--homocysteine methyltransferase
MAINFSPDRWRQIKATYQKWWENKIDRPLTGVFLYGRDPGRLEPDTPLLSQKTCTFLHIPAEKLVDRLDYELSKYEFLGDCFPYVNLDAFGPGVLAAFCGARLDNSSGGVWFHAEKISEISDIHIKFDPDNKWFIRIKDICKAAMDRWQGQVLVGMPDLGGTMDVLATFRTTENLLMDLIDSPEEVTRLMWEIHHAWHRAYEEINSVLQPYNPGYSDWSRIYSDKPCYVLQSDFSYMISPSMFDEFVKPELQESCRMLSHTLYHLDGVGELAHLDSLLKIEELDAVQWIPGAGRPSQKEWPEVYQKIAAAGKKIQIIEDLSTLDAVIKQTGAASRIHQMPIIMPISEEATAKKELARFGVL